MKPYVLFGAGTFGERAADLLGKEKIAFFIDNDEKKSKTCVNGISVHTFHEVRDRLPDHQIVLSVGAGYTDEIIKQLEEAQIDSYCTLREIQRIITREKINSRTDYLLIYKRAVQWISNNTLHEESVICHTNNRKGYPEVTGYFIPTLMKWGYRDLAAACGKWLCRIQKKDGSWYDAEDKAPYVFDTGQVLKGLLAIREICPEVDENIKKGCDWILSNAKGSGRLASPTAAAWGAGKKACSELVHLYCLSPLIQAADLYERPSYRETADRILNYYKKKFPEEILNFNMLSHFYAYVMEALLDLGERDIVRESMEKVAGLQEESGAVPAYQDVHWVCSVGMFQLALVWFRLGDMEHGNKAFSYACKLQNESGGWYGSYLTGESEDGEEKNDYFPTSEISWAVKYFLDALYCKNQAEFEEMAPCFLETVSQADGRYQAVRREIASMKREGGIQVLDVRCGKGRYLKNLLEDEPENRYFAVDLSEKVMGYIRSDRIRQRQGSLTCIPYEDQTFHITYACEALEHAVDIGSAVREMARVTRKGGKIVIVDKNKDMLGCMEIEQWEQWFDEKELRDTMRDFCSEVKTENKISCKDSAAEGLFTVWTGIVK